MSNIFKEAIGALGPKSYSKGFIIPIIKISLHFIGCW